jgi:hypothetical protein
MSMRAFLASCAVAIILAIAGVFLLGRVQRSAGTAFSTEGARINPAWSWRQMFGKTVSSPSGSHAPSGPTETAMAHVGPEGCEETNAYRWIFVDFGENESEVCAASQ